MLDEVPTLEPTSRLSCQLIWDESLDGLTARLDGELVRQKLEAA